MDYGPALAIVEGDHGNLRAQKQRTWVWVLGLLLTRGDT